MPPLINFGKTKAKVIEVQFPQVLIMARYELCEGCSQIDFQSLVCNFKPYGYLENRRSPIFESETSGHSDVGCALIGEASIPYEAGSDEGIANDEGEEIADDKDATTLSKSFTTKYTSDDESSLNSRRRPLSSLRSITSSLYNYPLEEDGSNLPHGSLIAQASSSIESSPETGSKLHHDINLSSWERLAGLRFARNLRRFQRVMSSLHALTLKHPFPSSGRSSLSTGRPLDSLTADRITFSPSLSATKPFIRPGSRVPLLT